MITIIGGVPTYTLAATVGSNEDNMTVNFGGFTLNYGSANTNYTLIGDVQTMTLSATGGSTGALSSYTELNNDTFNFGPNMLTVGNGNDFLYGDVQTLNLQATAGSISTGGDAHAMMEGDVFNFGSSTLTAGTGADSFYGAVGTMTLAAMGETESNVSQSDPLLSYDTFNFANNTINSSATSTAHDFLYGDIGTLALSDVAGSATNGGSADAWMYRDVFTFGSDTLTAGNGGDSLYGNVGTMNFTSTGGTVTNTSTNTTEAVGYMFQNAFQFGSNSLTAGNGTDHLYGAVGSMTFTVTGGMETDGNATAQIGSNSSIGYIFGDSTLHAGNGNGDVLYGDVGTITVNLQGGSGGAGGYASASFGNNVFTFGSDSLQVGSGNNDTLVGNVGSLIISLTAGTSTGGDGNVYFEENNFNFGGHTNTTFGVGSTLMAGSGHDTLIGDMQSFSLTVTASASASIMDAYNTINLGDNTLIAGSGKDTLYGSIVNLHDFDAFLSASSTNHVIGGGDLFIGGAGADTFNPGPGGNDFRGGTGADTYVFDMTLSGTNAVNGNGLNDGLNTLENFSAAKGDVLAFQGVHDINTLNAETSVMDDGTGHAFVLFNQNAGNGYVGNGTGLDFTNMTYNVTETHLLDVLSQNNVPQSVIHILS